MAYLLGNRDSAWRVAQDGREALMRPGDFVLVDARRPYHFDFPKGPSTVSLELPVDWLARWVAEPQAHTARPFRAGSSDWSAALAAFARPWRPDMATAPPIPAELLTDHLGALLSLACCGAPQTPPPSLAERAKNVLRKRLAEPGLTAAQVAADLGCSLRSLHRALAAARTPFAQLLIAERLRARGHTVHCPTLAGNRPADDRGATGLENAAQSLVAYLEQHNATAARLVGHSYGGMAARVVAR